MLLRVGAALMIATAWTVPLGVAIGTNRKLANMMQPIMQVTASVRATALFLVILLALIRVPIDRKMLFPAGETIERIADKSMRNSPSMKASG
jgi:ABC-type anion transport system duplicated permease subunit